MRLLYLTLLILLCSAYSGQANASPILSHKAALKALSAAAYETKVPFRLLAAICTVESSLRPFIKPIEDNGSLSYGMCQVKEETARFLGFASKASILSNPNVNAFYAAKYLKYQLNRYEGDWIRALAAYNAGSSHWHISNQEYVTKVLAQAVKF